MKTASISTFMKTLIDLLSDFSELDLSLAKKLLKEVDSVLKLFNGGSPLKNEIEQRRNDLRITVLKAIIKKEKEGLYSSAALDSCWEDFKLAQKMDYSSLGGGTDWNPGGLAYEAQNAVCVYIFNSIEKQLKAKPSTNSDAYKDTMKMLDDVRARYNHSAPQYKEAERLISEYKVK